MPLSPDKVLPTVEEDEAVGDVAEIYETLKRDMQMPFVPNMMKALAVSPAALHTHWGMMRAYLNHTTLPQSLFAMICFTIAEKSNCTYCSAGNELTCRTLGIDEETLTALIQDLDNVNPERIRAIIEFVLKVAKDPQGLAAEDYDRVRALGVTDEEIVEMVVVAALAVYSDIVADALKIEVEPAIAQALSR